MHSEMHQEKNGEPEILKEKSARESKSAVPRQERERRSARESEPVAPRQKITGKEEIAQESE